MNARSRAWLQAARLPSLTTIWVPLVFGQCLASAEGHPVSVVSFVLVLLFGLFDQLTIVFANDVADRHADRLNEMPTAFSGGSRVLVEGKLTPLDLARAAVVTALVCVVTALALSAVTRSPAPLVLSLVALGLLWLYSFGPARLSYRGGGEALQALGVGLVLPLLGFAAHAPTVTSFPWEWLLLLVPTELASALATTLPDAPGDVRAGKRTATVRFGARLVMRAIVHLQVVAAIALLWLSPASGLVTAAALVVPLVATALLPRVRGRPGTRRLSVYVFLCLLVTLSLVVGASVVVTS